MVFSAEKQEVIRYKHEANMFKGLHAFSQRQLERERTRRSEGEAECARLRHEIERLQRESAELHCTNDSLRDACRKLEEQLRETTDHLERLVRQNRWFTDKMYGSSSEKAAVATPSNTVAGEKKDKGQSGRETPPGQSRPRGFPKGRPGHGRRLHPELPVEETVIELPEAERRCPKCGKPFSALGTTEDGSQIAIEYPVIKRLLFRRMKYKTECECGACKPIVTAPAPSKVIPKCKLTDESLSYLLINKYVFNLPLNRLLAQLSLDGFDLATGTVINCFHRLTPLIVPVWRACRMRCLESPLWHMDETSWRVFERFEGKNGNRWWLWVFVGEDAAFYLIDPSRSGSVPLDVLGPDASGIAMTDRYSGYKRLPDTVLHVYCWAHVRRDFVKLLTTPFAQWAERYVGMIGELYHWHGIRGRHEGDTPEFAAAHEKLGAAFERIVLAATADLLDPALHPSQRSVLNSLDTHWDGLRAFMDNPIIPMDNNTAERHLRTPVVGRSNYYGGGSYWSARLAAAVWSIALTCRKHEVNVHKYLCAYLRACAGNRSQAPEDLTGLLPWEYAPG